MVPPVGAARACRCCTFVEPPQKLKRRCRAAPTHPHALTAHAPTHPRVAPPAGVGRHGAEDGVPPLVPDGAGPVEAGLRLRQLGRRRRARPPGPGHDGVPHRRRHVRPARPRRVAAVPRPATTPSPRHAPFCVAPCGPPLSFRRPCRCACVARRPARWHGHARGCVLVLTADGSQTVCCGHGGVDRSPLFHSIRMQSA